MKYGPVVPTTEIKQEFIEGNVMMHPLGDMPRQCLSGVDVTVGCEDWLTHHMKTSLLCSWKTSCHSTHSWSSKLRISCFLLWHHIQIIHTMLFPFFPLPLWVEQRDGGEGGQGWGDAIFSNQLCNQMPAQILTVTNMAFNVPLLHVNCISLQFRRKSCRATVGITITTKQHLRCAAYAAQFTVLEVFGDTLRMRVKINCSPTQR